MRSRWNSGAGGGFVSTAEDETLALLWTPMRTSDGPSSEYGIGWGVEQDSAGRSLIRHTEGGMGATAHLVI